MGRYITRKTVDINGGNIDGTVIGASSPASGTFTSITETSSQSLKENVEPISDSLKKILLLEGVSYNRKSSGKRESGLIAEEVEKVLPELVEGKGENRSISYSRLSAYLIEAVKDLKQRLDKASD